MGLEGLKRFRMRAHRHEALYELSSRVFMWIWGLGSRASGFGMRLGGIWDWALGFWGSVFRDLFLNASETQVRLNCR